MSKPVDARVLLDVATHDDEWMDCPSPRPTADSGTESFVTYRTYFPRLEIVPPS